MSIWKEYGEFWRSKDMPVEYCMGTKVCVYYFYYFFSVCMMQAHSLEESFSSEEIGGYPLFLIFIAHT